MFAVECAKDKREMWHLRSFPWCIATVLSYVSRAQCAICTLLRALCCIFGWSRSASGMCWTNVLQILSLHDCYCHVQYCAYNQLSLVQLNAAYKFSAWWSSNAFQVDLMHYLWAWCSKVSSLVTGSHIWRHLWWSSRWPDMLLPFLNGAILNWNDSSFSQKPFTFTLPSNWVLSGKGIVPRVINSRQRWRSCWGRRQVCKIQKQSETGWSTITITQGMNMIEVKKEFSWKMPAAVIRHFRHWGISGLTLTQATRNASLLCKRWLNST